MAGGFAYVVLSHSRPEQVRRLVRVLLGGGTGASVVCSHDPRGPRLGGPEFADPRVAVVADRPPVRWGDFSQYERLSEAIAVALGRFSPDWITVLSGQDFPVLPLPESEGRVAALGADLCIRTEPVGYVSPGSPDWRRRNEVARRYLLHQVALPGTDRWGRRSTGAAPGAGPRRPPASTGSPAPTGSSGSPGAATQRGVGGRTAVTDRLRRWVDLRRGPVGAPYRLGVHRLRPGPPGGRTLYKGSFWSTMSGDVGRRLVELPQTDPELLRWFRSTVNPDEAVVQTVIGNDPAFVVHPDNFRFVRWTPGSPHPDVLTVADLPELTASGRHFARKFDAEVDGEVLDRLERLVLDGA